MSHVIALKFKMFYNLEHIVKKISLKKEKLDITNINLNQ